MYELWEWLKRAFAPVPEPAPALTGMRALPIVVNPDESQRLTQAAYRIGAIRRHIEQSKSVSPQRCREFLAETTAHAGTLMAAGQMDAAAHDEAVGFVIAAMAS